MVQKRLEDLGFSILQEQTPSFSKEWVTLMLMYHKNKDSSFSRRCLYRVSSRLDLFSTFHLFHSAGKGPVA